MSNSIGIFVLPALRVGQPNEVDGYMIVARDLLQGVEALSTLPPNVPSRGCALIAAHALECALKAFLWHKGKKKEIRERDVQHDLVVLWNMAYKEKGLSIPQVPPDWVTTLSSGHGPNFYFRYQKGEGKTVVHGGQTPALIPMAVALKNLIEMVGLAVKG
ncbi:MAG: hypothetical protein ABSH06_09935 [Thermodesulfobacteriota bacterium]